MFPSYRIVWDEEKDLTYVVSAWDTGYDCVLNGLAGKILYDLACGKIDWKQVQCTWKDFSKQILDFSVVDEAGKVQGTISTVPAGTHLKRVQLELSRHCNLRCNYCYSISGPSQRTSIAFDTVLQLLTDANSLGCIWVDLTGGEFFLYPKWQGVLNHARCLGLITSIHTNGTVLTKNHVEILSQVGVRHVQVSMDSHLSFVHDEIRGLKGAFEKTIQGIRAAKDAGLNVRVSLMAHRDNANHYREMVRWFSEELDVHVLLDRIIPAGGELTAKRGISTKEFFEIISPLVSDRVSKSKVCENKSVNNHEDVEPECGVAQSFVYVTAEGEFALCPTMTSRDSNIFRGPTLKEFSLKEAWLNSDYFNRYRFTNCRNVGFCPTAKSCGGGCRSNAYLESGEIDAPDLLSCNLQKNPTNSFIDFQKRYSHGQFTLPKV